MASSTDPLARYLLDRGEIVAELVDLGAVECPGGKWRCPFHADRNPSASLFRSRRGGHWWFKCHACNFPPMDVFGVRSKRTGRTRKDEVIEQLRADDSGRRPKVRRSMAKILATYPYRDAKGRLKYECVRMDGGPSKCLYRRPAYPHDEPKSVRKDADGNKWVWDGQDCDLDLLIKGEISPAPPVLYRLPEILAADPKQPVLIAEGEKDAEAAAALGFVATTNPHGAQHWPSDAAFSVPLAGRRCVLFEDNDEAGRRHCIWVAGCLVAHGAASVRVVTFRDHAEHFDLSDLIATPAWQLLDRAGKRKELAATVQLFPEWVRQAPFAATKAA